MPDKLKTIIFIACTLFTGAGAVCAQDWKADLLAMNKTYLRATSFSMDVTVESFESAADLKPAVEYKGSAAKKNENYFSTMAGKTTILNKRCKVVVDNGQKMILYKENKDHGKSAPTGFFTLANLDSAFLLMARENDVTYLANTKDEKRIQVRYKKGGNSKVEVCIHPASNTLTQIIYYTEKPEGDAKIVSKVIVKYSNIKLDQPIPDELFSEKKYLDKKMNGISLSKKYSHYQLVNQNQVNTP